MRYYLAGIGAWLVPGAILAAVTGVWWVFPAGLVVTAKILEYLDEDHAS